MLATDQLLSEAHERERQQYRQEIDSLTRAMDKARHDCLTQLNKSSPRSLLTKGLLAATCAATSNLVR